MITILEPHSCGTDLSMMMLPAGQTMGLPPLGNVLVPGQGCVAYLTRQNYWLLSSDHIMLDCICVFNVNTNICFLYLQFTTSRCIPNPTNLLSIVFTGWNIIIWKSRRQTDRFRNENFTPSKIYWAENFEPSSRNVSDGRLLPQRRCTPLRR